MKIFSPHPNLEPKYEVTPVELFFDLVFVFGVSQLSHHLLEHVSWRGVAETLVWYFTNLSIVNVIYGSLTGPVIAWLTLEAGSIIILLGAQVIAEYELISLNFAATNADTPV